MNPIDFTPREQIFINSLLGASADKIKQNYSTYISILEKLLLKFINPELMVHDIPVPMHGAAVTSMANDIAEKIYEWRFYNELENVLTMSDEEVAREHQKHVPKDQEPARLSQTHLSILSLLGMREMTRIDIATETGMSLSSVCGRVNELSKWGYVISGRVVIDKNSNKKVTTVTYSGKPYVV